MSNTTNNTDTDINRRAAFMARAWSEVYGDGDITTYEQMVRNFHWPHRDMLKQYVLVTQEGSGLYRLHTSDNWDMLLGEGRDRMFDRFGTLNGGPQHPRWMFDLDAEECWRAEATVVVTRVKL